MHRHCGAFYGMAFQQFASPDAVLYLSCIGFGCLMPGPLAGEQLINGFPVMLLLWPSSPRACAASVAFGLCRFDSC